MSNIEKAVQAAIEEFGDEAFKIFVIKSTVFNSEHTQKINDNSDVKFALLRKKYFTIELKPLPELFSHGVEFYGFEQEVRMWEFKGIGGDWQDIPDHADYSAVLRGLKDDFYQHRRKTSAQREFNLDDARAGDVVEICNEYGNWSDCTSKTFESIKFPLIRLDRVSTSEFNLRMKYPKKVQS